MAAQFNDRTKQLLSDRLGDYLDATGRSSRKAFCCINPAHNDKHPSMSYDRENRKAHCFSCGVSYDIFDVIGIDYNLATYPEQYQKACEYFGVSQSDPAKKKTATDLTDYFRAAHSRITETDYHRGLSRETLDRFNIGYDPEWKHPKRYSDEPSPRLIIPTGKDSYVARYTGAGDFTGYDGQKMNKGKVGASRIFNVQALSSPLPVFIVEGELDAMSIEQAGYPAIGLGSTTGVNLFLATVKASKERPQQPFIIALDNEDNPATRKAEASLLSGLSVDLGLSAYVITIYDQYKDANAYLMADPEGFRASLQKAVDEATKQAEEEKETERDIYIRENCAASFLNEFLDGISASANTPAISTGIAEIDDALDGGLYPGLYFLGAISSLGKTSLALQIADSIAQAEHDVLFFSLEMARTELMAKSISRHTFNIALSKTGRTETAKTARGITDGSRWKHYTKDENIVISKALEAYASYAEHIFITEAIGRIGTAQIREAIQKHISLTGRKPVVFIDYLQILVPADMRATDKQSTDASVTELKQISRDFNIPILAISSLNRASYKEAISMEAFKESGSIEYGSDVLIGLQLQGAGKPNFDAQAAKQKNPREIELVILKNRNGPTGSKADLEYYPLFNYFTGEE